MSINLFHLAMLILIPTTLVRSSAIFLIFRKFVDIFESKSDFKTARHLMKELEIPGFTNYIRQEIILGVIPYLSLIGLIFLSNLRNFNFNEFGLFVAIVTILCLLIWVIIDVVKSILIYRKLAKLAKDTSTIKNISGSAIEGLRFIVHRKGIVKRTLVKYTVSATKKSLQQQQEVKKSWWRKASIRGLSAVENITSFPERVTKKLADWMKEDLDEKLMKRFENYSSRSKISVFGNFLWALFPSLVLLVLIQLG